MVDQEQYIRYLDDSKVLAAIGAYVDAQAGLVTVRLPRAVAEAAVDAWKRDELGDLDAETHQLVAVRNQAAELALIGLVISQSGRWEGENLVVGLDVASAGAALRAFQESSPRP
ncbi:hypothetical protein FH608_048805 [Nonomuraea phyllanthi]|uniref:Uncharacterized protein n=1 Tax=Nonomuraea phyllanthi TaxID=2219224 RepID=A0A5C4UZ31_9ACTN|nr:hypothetical protein [Nonomuraea phyllanthi]KAB8183938.1 hypothetical protein FH608_048805 [Nonomuraea phyllanthi]